MGSTVTQRIADITQPRGGYIPPKTLTMQQLSGGVAELPSSVENVHPGLVGTTVDSLTRFASGSPAEEAFRISLMGASHPQLAETANARRLIRGMKGLDDASVTYATQLCGYDTAYRAGISRYVPVSYIRPDRGTVANIRAMVERALSFLDEFGPKTADGFTFEGGYTDTVSKGDGDFLTLDTLWDFKVSKNPPTKDHTLQILMYWRMGLRSVHPEFRSIRYLGIFNPRLNTVYRIAVDDIPQAVIDEVDTVVIGYNKLR